MMLSGCPQTNIGFQDLWQALLHRSSRGWHFQSHARTVQLMVCSSMTQGKPGLSGDTSTGAVLGQIYYLLAQVSHPQGSDSSDTRINEQTSQNRRPCLLLMMVLERVRALTDGKTCSSPPASSERSQQKTPSATVHCNDPGPAK